MAEIKKYLDLAAATKLVELVKAEDVKVKNAAEAYANSLAGNYDASGSAATAESNAKAYADEKVGALADGQVKTNKEAIATLNGDATTAGSVAKAVKDAQDALQANIDAVDDKADKNAEDIAAINDGTNGILATAKAYTDAEVAKVQGEVDALEGFVGELPEGTSATTVIGYVDAKTANIASDETVNAIDARLTQAEKDIDAIEADYLKAADKTELEGKITAEENARKGADDALSARIKAVEDDYLKAADKTELTNAIATAKQEAIATVLGEGVDADFDTLKEVADWILSDTTGAAALQTDVATLKGEMDAVEGRMDTAEGDIDALEGEVAKKVDQTAYNEKVAALEGADAGQVERIAALEAKFGGADGSVEDQIADAKQEAITAATEAAAADATSKANAAESAAKSHADGLNTAMNARVDALEAVDHEHANKELLDTYTQTEANLADAVAKKHNHENKSVLDGISAEKVAAWDAAEGNAKTYADGLNTTMTGKVDAIDGRLQTVEGKIDNKAEDSDLDAAVERIAANEAAIAANASAIAVFTPITTGEIESLFA